MSPRRNWDSPTPSPASECAPPWNQRGGGARSPAGEGGVPISTVCILSVDYPVGYHPELEFVKQSMGARKRVEIGLSYRPARLNSLVELVPWNHS
jgi:hypothetical protein